MNEPTTPDPDDPRTFLRRLDPPPPAAPGDQSEMPLATIRPSSAPLAASDLPGLTALVVGGAALAVVLGVAGFCLWKMVGTPKGKGD